MFLEVRSWQRSPYCTDNKISMLSLFFTSGRLMPAFLERALSK
jgi:hypothetical protein